MPPGRAHAIVHFRNDDGSFRGWYVNLQDELRETRFGVDTRDQQLDLWIEAGETVTWKDEHHLGQAIELGLMTADECLGARREAERVLEEWPFPTGWEDWQPDPGWPLPALPADWATR
jgi:predicted RNA-binding protein associated with RNAse of E/G family